MKKLFLAFALLISMLVQAREQVTLSFTGVYDKGAGNHTPKAPMRPPVVYLDDHTLSFVTGHPDYTLLIKDEGGDVVYTTTVFSAETEVVLPSTLFGDYEIQLTMGNWLFTGYVSIIV